MSHLTQSLTSNSKNSKVKLFAHPDSQINSQSYSREKLLINKSAVVHDNYFTDLIDNINLGGLM